MRHATWISLLILAFAASAAAPAEAAPVLVVGGDGARVEEDPYLPSAAATKLPRSPQAAARPRGATFAAGPSVKRVLRSALDAGQLQGEDYARYRDLYKSARSARRRLSGARENELASVIRTLERIARAGELTTSRMPALFLTLERNTDFWLERSFPGSGLRVRFGSSPVTFQYYPGEGLQIQPLANFGKANALYNACDAGEGEDCRTADDLRELLDQMAALAARRSGFVAWEYYFEYAGGEPPWISGIAQGTGIQAMTRGSELLSEPRYRELASSALGAFEKRAPTGVRVSSRGGSHYLLYSFDRRLLVLNGFLQAVTGLFDYSLITGDERGLRLFERGDRAARRELKRYDTGAWSLYSMGGRESTLNYHELVTGFMGNLCERTGHASYCDREQRFKGYLEEPPRLELITGDAQAERRTRLRFRLSKVARVKIVVSRGDTVVRRETERFFRGKRYVVWTPRSAGTYDVRLEAVDLAGNEGSAEGTIVVRKASDGQSSKMSS